MKKKFRDFELRIGLASDSTIRSWSSGEVKKPETINYKSEKPVRDGLFCERIFGPIRDNECSCGKYKRIRNKGKVCEKCEVQVTDSIVRRRRMGHIELDEPVVHIWYYKSIPSKLSAFLDLPLAELQEIIYYRSYVLVNNCKHPDIPHAAIIALDINLKNLNEKDTTFILIQNILNQIILDKANDSEVKTLAEEYLSDLSSYNESFFVEEFVQFVNENSNFNFQTGGLAIEGLLKSVNIEATIRSLKTKLKLVNYKTSAINDKMLRRLEILNSFQKTGQKPEWMLTRTIPVLPPELRPIVSLEGGRLAASGINSLYIELLIRKNRLQKFKDKSAPLFKINELVTRLIEVIISFLK